MTTNVVPLGQIPRWNFSDRIRKIRRDAGLSQGVFASRLGVGAGALGQWESGRNHPDDIVRVAQRVQQEFGISAAWVLGLDDNSSGPDGDGGNAVTET